MNSLEEYVEAMQPWLTRIAGKHAYRNHPLLDREDLRQDAAAVLAEVWRKYADRVPEIELRRIGSTAMFNEVRNVIHRTCRRGDAAAVMVELAEDSATGADEFDRVVIRDGLERLAQTSVDVRAVVGASSSASPSEIARAMFQRARRQVHDMLQGYSSQKPNASDTREASMNDEVMEPQTGEETDMAEKKKAPKGEKKPKSKATKPKSKATKPKATKPKGEGSVSAAESVRAAKAFEADQVVTCKESRAGWLKVGQKLTVRGFVGCRGRGYVRCVTDDKKTVVLAPHLLTVRK